MTAKKAHTRTMILLVVPRGFSTGTELLNTRAHSSQMDFPMVKVEPPGPVGGQARTWTSQAFHSPGEEKGLPFLALSPGLLGNRVPGGSGRRGLTFACGQAAVIAHRTEVLKDENGDGNHGEAHDEHHHPHSGAVGLWGHGRRQPSEGLGDQGSPVDSILLSALFWPPLQGQPIST